MRMVAIGVAIFLILSLAFLMANNNAGFAQDDDSKVISKLDEILKNQKEILEEIASIKEELSVIRVRVTR